MQEIQLPELGIGENARVVGINRASPLYTRFIDMGITLGAKIKCVGKSPGNSPRAYLIRGAVIAIRNKDAAAIIVKRSGEYGS